MSYNRIFKKIGLLGAIIICGLLIRKAYGSSADAVWPVANGIDVRVDGNLRLDCSNTVDGYIMMSLVAPTGNAFKVQLSYNGGQLLYDLNAYGNYEVLPLQFGPGYYSVSLFENVAGSKYASSGKLDVNIAENDCCNRFFIVAGQKAEQHTQHRGKHAGKHAGNPN